MACDFSWLGTGDAIKRECEDKLEEKKVVNEEGVGIGTVLTPGIFKVEEEVQLPVALTWVAGRCQPPGYTRPVDPALAFK